MIPIFDNYDEKKQSRDINRDKFIDRLMVLFKAKMTISLADNTEELEIMIPTSPATPPADLTQIKNLIKTTNEEMILLKNRIVDAESVNSKLQDTIKDLKTQLAILTNKVATLTKRQDKPQGPVKEPSLKPEKVSIVAPPPKNEAEKAQPEIRPEVKETSIKVQALPPTKETDRFGNEADINGNMSF